MSARTALVTGGARGIGLAVATLFREMGVEVLAPTRSEMNLLSDRSIDDYIGQLKVPVDILVNNAGINILGCTSEINAPDLDAMIKTNLLAPLRLIKGVVPGMERRGYGRIVNISSIWGAVSKKGRVLYSTTKAGLDGMTRSMAVEFARNGVLINSVAPGYVNTELTRKNNSDAELKAIADTIPLGRLAETEEIARLVYFLSSENNSYITGQTLFIDGGFTCL
jgi:3-oxoacyl-[acyl-carrier protein] reductase